MASVVVFVTTYALILPAITLEQDAYCGIEAHVHDESCYVQVTTVTEEQLVCTIPTHVHAEGCWEKTQGDLICTEVVEVPHEHTDACNGEIKTLVCEEAECAPHAHTDACYTVPKVLTCTQEEIPAHAHSEACWTTHKILVCELAEQAAHHHADACYTAAAPVLTCGIEESEEHTHADACYTAGESVLSCTIEETEGHAHGDACYADSEPELTCGTDETEGHAHTDACYTDGEPVVSCGLEETLGHTHSDACYEISIGIVCTTEMDIVHEHTDECYTWVDTLICELEEADLTQELHEHADACYETVEVPADTETMTCTAAEADHVHTALCYGTWSLNCTMEEHEHELQCYADFSADVETAAVWEQTFAHVELTGNAAKDAVAIAKTQIGYTESAKNYMVEEDGETIKGYTRYGSWYGEPYADWCAMFVSFCLHYGGAEDFPLDAGCDSWIAKLSKMELYRTPAEHIPNVGDLIFFDYGGDGSSDHVGIVEDVIDTNVVVIEGNSNNRVERHTYALHDGSIAGYGMLNMSPTPVEENPVVIGPKDANAWAVLVDSDDQIMQTAMNETEVLAAASSRTYALRNTSATLRSSARAVGTPLDLTPFIKEVTMYDEEGNVISNGSVVTEGDIIKFEITYSVDGQKLGVLNDQTITVYSDTITYKLPDTFKVVRGESGNIVNASGQTVGTYQIDSETNMITMTFMDDYVEQNATGIQINGSIAFYSTVTKITDNENENQDYKFTDEITLGVIIEEKEEVVGDLSIEKKAASVDGEEIVYEVKVTSAEGTKGPVTITDTMSKGLTFKEGIEVLDSNNNKVTVSFTPAADNCSFTMTLSEMKAGDSYTIRYRCTADIDLLGADMTVRNTASVTGKDSQDHDLKDETTVDYVFEMLKKTGEDNGDGTITWTITVNQAKADISGWILEDIMGGNQPFGGPVTITGSSGNVIAQSATLPYTFPLGSNDTYTITYTTTHDYSAGNTVYNKAILRDDDTEVNVVTGVGIGTPITKTAQAGELTQDENGKYILPITWTVTIDTTKGEIPAGEFLYDKMDGYPSDDMYMTYDQLMAAISNIRAEVQRVSGADLGWTQAAIFKAGEGHGEYYHYDELVNNVSVEEQPGTTTHTAVYERFGIWLAEPIPKGQRLTFTYETYGVFDNNVVVGSRFVNRFSISDNYEVEATVDFGGGNVKATKYGMLPYDPNSNENQDWTMDWSNVEGISRFDYNDLHDDYLVWAIELSTPLDYWGSGNIVLYENLPEGVSVKGLDLNFLNNVPTSRLQMRDLEPGETQTWDFAIYPAEQYGQWNPQGGQTVSIVVKLTENGDLEITMPSIIFETMAQRGEFENQWLDENKKHTEWWGYLYIYTQINEDFEWTPEAEGSQVYVNAFENKFTLKNENGEVIDIGSQSQVITKDESTGAIRKEATTDENNIITYSVVLNAYGRDLVENSGTLSIHDELTYIATVAKPLRLRLVPGSVKLYEIDMASDGTYTRGEEVSANYSYNETSSEESGSTTWVHTIDMNVPDGKALLLEYSYKASGTANQSYDVLNTCSVNGVGDGGLDEDHELEIEVKKSSAQADIEGVMLYKVDADSDGIFLENARFNIYIWNEDQNQYILVHHPDNNNADFITDQNGMIILDPSTMNQFAYNTAYYIVEVQSPNGYYLGPEPYYFQIVHEDTATYRPCLPDGFDGRKLTSGDIIYRKNVSNTTEISVEKYWLDYNGKSVTVTGEEVFSVTLELWQMLQDQPDKAKVYGTYTMTPDADGNWRLTITDLPKATKNEDGTKGDDYLYYIKEVAVNGYVLESSENNEGINFGTIKLVNREQLGYVLPETGGAGTNYYTMAGLLMMICSGAYLMYRNKRRREDA